MPTPIQNLINRTDPFEGACQLVIDTTKEGSASNTFVLPTTGTGYNYDISWGDGVVQTIQSNESQTHVYPASGIYTIKIKRDFPTIYFNDAGDKLKVLQWNPGNVAWLTLESSFYGCANLTAVRGPANMAKCTSMIGTFRGCSALAIADLSTWNTANVTAMNAMFYGCTSFNQSVANFNTANVTAMDSMFRVCAAFNQSVANFNTANVTAMDAMFYGCIPFNQSVANFDTAKVTNMNSMFRACAAFNQSVANFNTANVTNMSYMFYGCTSFKQDLSGFNITSLTSATSMLYSTNINDTGTTTRYNALLNSWAAQAFKLNVPFHAGSAKYSAAGADARATLVAAGWSVVDGGLQA